MKKKLLTTISLVIIAGLLVAGTFAWVNFDAQIINQFFGQGSGDLQTQQGPGGTLHNDFVDGEDYRDIYIENWGTEPMIVRIHLSEYMEVGPGAGNSINNEAVSLVEGALLSDPSTWTPFSGDLDDVISLADSDASSFRDFWRWTMGGQKYFFPAPEDLRGNHNGVEFVSTVSPPNLSPSELDTVSRTLDAEVISMDEWISQGRPTGQYWVVDIDGFSYWAAPLLPNEATGLLLHKIEQIRVPIYDYFYALNVQGHMASIDDAPDNYERMITNASEDAASLIRLVAEEIRMMSMYLVDPEEQELIHIDSVDRATFDTFDYVDRITSNNQTAIINDAVKLVYSADSGWNIVVDDEDIKGVLPIAYEISNQYFFGEIWIRGAGEYHLISGSGNEEISNIKIGEYIETVITVLDTSDYDLMPGESIIIESETGTRFLLSYETDEADQITSRVNMNAFVRFNGTHLFSLTTPRGKFAGFTFVDRPRHVHQIWGSWDLGRGLYSAPLSRGRSVAPFIPAGSRGAFSASTITRQCEGHFWLRINW